MHPLVILLCALLLGCGRSTPPACPDDMVHIRGGSFRLGETDLTQHTTIPEGVLRAIDVTVAPYCVARLPFPGIEGGAWPADGLTHSLAGDLDREVRSIGRRICTVEELLLATAGPDNLRYPWGNDPAEGVCPHDAAAPGLLGAKPDCVSPTGIRDVRTRSEFARLTPAMDRHLAAYDAPRPPPHTGTMRIAGARYVSYGGTPNRKSFYAPNNFSVHAHQVASDEAFPDDSTRLCADPGAAASSEEYAAWVAGFLADPRYGTFLSGR